jgi:hypothetical protein
MQLIDTLISGVEGAGSGTAEIRKRGTASFATTYQDFQGTVTNVDGPLTLDSEGQLEVYVNELVEVTVKDSAGTVVAQFVNANDAPAVEVKSLSFTGPDYDTAAVAAGGPTTLQAVLDLVLASFGSTDFKVLIGGVATLLQDAFGFSTELFYNVKSPVYGAVGDGTTDDTVAIQAAMTAASAAGGGVVFFPQGRYRTTATLNPGANVSMWGANSDACTIEYDAATGNVVNVNYGATTGQTPEIRNLAIFPVQSHSGNILNGGGSYLVSNCDLGSATLSTGALVVSAANFPRPIIEYTRFRMGGEDAIRSTGSEAYLVLHGCEFVTPIAYTPTNAIVYGDYIQMTSCVFDMEDTTSGTFSCYKPSANGHSTINGCNFKNPGNAAVVATGFELGAYTASFRFAESDQVLNVTTDRFTLYDYTPAYATLGADVRLGTRKGRTVRYTANNDLTLTVETDQVDTIYIERDTATTALILTCTDGPEGSECFIIIENTSGGNTGAITVVGDSGASVGTASVVIATTNWTLWHFKMVANAARLDWTAMSAREDIAT